MLAGFIDVVQSVSHIVLRNQGAGGSVPQVTVTQAPHGTTSARTRVGVNRIPAAGQVWPMLDLLLTQTTQEEL